MNKPAMKILAMLVSSSCSCLAIAGSVTDSPFARTLTASQVKIQITQAKDAYNILQDKINADADKAARACEKLAENLETACRTRVRAEEAVKREAAKVALAKQIAAILALQAPSGATPPPATVPPPGTGTPPPVVTDTIKPSTPSALAATSGTSNSVTLAWHASTDNVGVKKYLVKRNGAQIAETETLGYVDAAAAANTYYSYQVIAVDAAGNLSAPSTAATITTPAATAAKYPADLLDNHLKNWKIALPTDNDGSGTADEVKQPALATLSNKYFMLNDAKDGVLFTTPINGIRTSNNTKYVRSELREVYAGADQVGSNYWPCSATKSKPHSMHIEQIVRQSSTHKPEVAVGQIHDDANDNLMVKYTGPSNARGTNDTGQISIKWNNNTSSDLVDPAYTMGDLMVVDVSVSSTSLATVTYKNKRTGVTVTKSKQLQGISGPGCFFKAGNYIQDCVDKSYTYTNIMGQTANNSSCTSGTPATNATQTSIVEIRKLTVQ